MNLSNQNHLLQKEKLHFPCRRVNCMQENELTYASQQKIAFLILSHDDPFLSASQLWFFLENESDPSSEKQNIDNTKYT